MTTPAVCPCCRDTRWVCEEHPDKPMDHDGCEGAGKPCPDCNPSSRGKVPVLPPDFEIVRSQRDENEVLDERGRLLGQPNPFPKQKP
jgi:hypothetical protein